MPVSSSHEENRYREDLAFIHHVGFERESTAAAAPYLLGMLRRAGICGGLVIDLGCGGGSWLRELGRAGFEALGVDSSPAMVELARREAPAAEVVCTSLFELSIPRCVAVTCLGEGLCYLPATGRGRRPSLSSLFARVAQALSPGGLFLFDVVVTGRHPMAYRSWRAGEDWAVLVEVGEDTERRLLTRDITTFRRQRGRRGYRRDHEQHLQRVYSREEIEAALLAAGFAVRARRGWGRNRLPARRLAFRAQREA